MEPFEVPSGGDMSYHDGGAVRFHATEGCSVSNSLFKNLGGTGVMIRNYNRDTVVDSNEFLFVGEHAICSMGRGDRQDQLDGDVPTRKHLLQPGTRVRAVCQANCECSCCGWGAGARSGKRLRMRGRACVRATAHHQALPGLLLAQGFYYQAVSMNASLEGNVFFNGPRAGINVR